MGIFSHFHNQRLANLIILCLFMGWRAGWSQSHTLVFPQSIQIVLESDEPAILAFGEFHDQRNITHKIPVLKSLHETYGFQHLLLEYPVCEERLMNRFVNGEDSLYYTISDAYILEEDRNQLMEFIRDFNKLHPDKRIVVHCIDTGDGRFSTSSDALRLTFKGREDIKEQLPLMYRKLIRRNYGLLKSQKSGRRITNKLIRDFEQRRRLYQSVLKEETSFYERSLQCMYIATSLSRKEWRHAISFYERESFISSNIRTLLQNDSICKVVGFFGNWHVNKLTGVNYLHDSLDWQTMMSILKKDSTIHSYSVFTDYLDAPKYIKDNYGKYPSKTPENNLLLKAILGGQPYELVDAKLNGLSNDVYLYCDLLLIRCSDIYAEAMPSHEMDYLIRQKQERKAAKQEGKSR